MSDNCPVCSESAKITPREDADYIECIRCGCFALTGTTRALLASNLREDNKARARVSHSICKMSRSGRWITINSDLLRSILQSTDNPSPPEQLDHLIVWLGETQGDPGARVDATARTIAAVGALDNNGLGFVVSEARRHDLVNAKVEVVQGLGQSSPQWSGGRLVRSSPRISTPMTGTCTRSRMAIPGGRPRTASSTSPATRAICVSSRTKRCAKRMKPRFAEGDSGMGETMTEHFEPLLPPNPQELQVWRYSALWALLWAIEKRALHLTLLDELRRKHDPFEGSVAKATKDDDMVVTTGNTIHRREPLRS